MSSTPHEVNPKEGNRHTHTVIFLHGRDSLAEEFASEIFESEASPSYAASVSATASSARTLPDLLPTVRWVFPCAPLLHSARFDTQMSQWFDIWSVENPSERSDIQIPCLKQSIEYMHDVINREAARVEGGRKNIFLAGISQGFATALAAYFADGTGGFAGLIGLSSWLPFVEEVEEYLDNTATDIDPSLAARQMSQIYRFGSEGLEVKGFTTPIFLGHCADDQVVPHENGERMKKALAGIMGRCGGSVEWHSYGEGGHWLNEPQGVDDLVSFVRRNSEVSTVVHDQMN